MESKGGGGRDTCHTHQSANWSIKILPKCTKKCTDALLPQIQKIYNELPVKTISPVSIICPDHNVRCWVEIANC